MKSHTNPHHLANRNSHKENGVALLTVLIILLLSSILVLGAFRVGFLNEILVGAESDHNRTRAAAEALLRDAEIDIRGRRPPYDAVQSNGIRGTPCRPTPDVATSLNVAANFRIYPDRADIGGCRAKQLANTPYIPDSADLYEDVRTIVQTNRGGNFATFPCNQGICTPPDLTTMANFANNPTADMLTQGATYGQFTRQTAADAALNGASNPILATPTARYWIEVFRMERTTMEKESVKSTGAPANPRDRYKPADDYELVYRITARAVGLKPGTQVVLSTLFIPYPENQIQ